MSVSPELAAEQILGHHDLGAVPVDLSSLARQMGVSAILERQGHGDGRLEMHDGALSIVVRPRTGAERRRFTIAHELGHVYLRRAQMELKPLAEERFCNAFAGAVLMPRIHVRRRQNEPEALATLLTFASELRVSLGAALVRLRQVCGWQCSLLRWRQDGDLWSLWAATCLPLDTPLPTAFEETSAALNSSADYPGISRRLIPLLIGGSVVAAEAELLRTPRGALVFFKLGKNVGTSLKADSAAAMWRDLASRLEFAAGGDANAPTSVPRRQI